MEVWFEKQLFRNSRGCLCVEGREGLEKAPHPFQMGLKQEVLDLQLLHFGSQVLNTLLFMIMKGFQFLVDGFIHGDYSGC